MWRRKEAVFDIKNPTYKAEISLEPTCATKLFLKTAVRDLAVIGTCLRSHPQAKGAHGMSCVPIWRQHPAARLLMGQNAVAIAGLPVLCKDDTDV